MKTNKKLRRLDLWIEFGKKSRVVSDINYVNWLEEELVRYKNLEMEQQETTNELYSLIQKEYDNEDLNKYDKMMQYE